MNAKSARARTAPKSPPAGHSPDAELAHGSGSPIQQAATKLDALQAFAVFADTLNFSETARQLHISQPALHTKIRKLGEHLRVPLYVRQGRALALTAEGLDVARHARELLALNQRFVRSLAGDAPADSVSLVAGEGAYLHLLGQAITRFRRAQPQAQLRLLVGDRERAMAAVQQAEQFTASPSDLPACPPHLDHADKHSLAERCYEVMQHVTPKGVAVEAAR